MKVKRFGRIQRFSELCFCLHFCALDARIPLRSQQLTANHIQIDQGAVHKRPIGILHQATVTHSGETGDALDDQGRMLLDDLGLTSVCRVVPDAGFRAVQQMRQDLAVMRVGGRERHRMHELALAIRANARLHAGRPRIGLPGLTHPGVARLPLIPGRGGGTDDGSVHHRALRNPEAARLLVSPDPSEHVPAQIVFLQQAVKLADGVVGHRLAPRINTCKPTHRHRVVQRPFHRRIREIEPVLQAVDSSHPLQSDRQMPVTGLGIHRQHRRAKLAPRNHAIHLRQKLRSPGRLRVASESSSGQRHSSHRLSPLEPSRKSSATYKTFNQMTYSVFN
jgi:hypothetical protein